MKLIKLIKDCLNKSLENMERGEIMQSELLNIAQQQLKINSTVLPKEVIDANRLYDIAKTVLPKTIVYSEDENGDLDGGIDFKLSCEDAINLAKELLKQIDNETRNIIQT